MAFVAGVDSSTQSTKVEIRDLDSGEIVASASAPHPSVTPPVSEQVHFSPVWGGMGDVLPVTQTLSVGHTYVSVKR